MEPRGEEKKRKDFPSVRENNTGSYGHEQRDWKRARLVQNFRVMCQ